MGNSHRNFLLRNHWANCKQTLVEGFLDCPLPKMCPVIPTSNQDGHQAKFLCEFPIGFYAKLSLAVGTILVEGPNRRTHFWKRTIQILSGTSSLIRTKLWWNSHWMVLFQIVSGSRALSPRWPPQCSCVVCQRAEPPDTMLEEDHLMTILSKFGSNWATGSRQEDFYVNFP
jgi:hypothetical protein